MSVQIKRRWLFGLAVVLILLGLAACGTVQTDLYLNTGPEYRVVAKISIPAKQVAAAGGVEALDKQAEQTAAQAKEHGISVSWERNAGADGAVEYHAETSLNPVTNERNDYFSLTPVSFEGQNAYRFQFTFFEEILGQVSERTVRLHAAKVLSHNGRLIDAGTVEWTGTSARPEAVVQLGRAGVHMGYLAGAIALLVLMIAASVYLLHKGLLQAWVRESSKHSKNRRKASRLQGDLGKLEQERALLYDNLGNKVWTEKMADPGYALPYQQLEALEAKLVPIGDHLRSLDLDLSKAQEERATLVKEYDEKIAGLQNLLTQAMERQAAARGEIDASESAVAKLNKQKSAYLNELHGHQSKMASLQESDLPDKEQQINNLNNTIATLGKQVFEVSDQIPVKELRIAELRAKLPSLQEEVEKSKDALAQMQESKRVALEPVDQNIQNIKDTTREREEERRGIKAAMQPVIRELGVEADRVRPQPNLLSDFYQKLDASKESIQQTSSDADVVRMDLARTDKGAVTRFWLYTAAVLVVLAAIVVLLVLAF